ncbi:hypothetical protein B0H63DRAFT_509500 [Podospora didyma]|uniref:Uncharacterized protein n=1 Tax=Podospora didyma TaxID=330526 RepID=A0AAE0NU92_9PEZI|nr:hypothetical protein B0H63DRAFT_509500 [Podospora didyma]
MKIVAALLASASLASAGRSFSSRRSLGLFKRWDYDVCLNDCTLAGVPIPDKDNLQLPLENNWSEQCPPIYIGPYDAPLATSRVCLDFVGPYVYFNVSAFPGYSTKSATVTWKLKGNAIQPSGWSSPPPTTAITCSPAAVGDDYICKLPFSDILGVSPTTSITNLLAGMCPNGDREGLVFYFEFSGTVQSTGGPLETFNQQYPCTTRQDRTCTAWDTSYPYFELSYRCSKCNVSPCPPPPSSTSAPPPPASSTAPPVSSSSTTSYVSSSSSAPPPPPVTVTCGFGTAFGYQAPVGGVQKSITLNTQSGKGCNRWGWYETPTLAELQSGISGPLYVGAGGNDISKAVNVGTWTAFANALGKVTVTYTTTPPYVISQVHVDLGCLPIDKCAPGTYTYSNDGVAGVPVWATTPIQYPTCSGGSKAALILHAAIDVLTTATTCAPPKAT